MKSIRTLACLMVLAVPLTLRAEPMMGYSGRLLGEDDQALSGAFDMVFRIYDAQTGGTLLFEEQMPATTVTNGFFTVMLGANELISPDALDLQELFVVHRGGVFLEIEIDGETLSPRQPLGAVPWALGGGTLATLGCEAGQVPLWDGVSWGCISGGGGIASVTGVGPVETSGDPDVSVGLQSCGDGQVLMADADGGWDCAEPVSILDPNGEACPEGSILSYGEAGWGCVQVATVSSIATPSGGGLTGGGDGDVTLRLRNCSNGQVLKYSGGSWGCAPDENSGGTVTGVSTQILQATTQGSTLSGSPQAQTDSCPSGTVLVGGGCRGQCCRSAIMVSRPLSNGWYCRFDNREYEGTGTWVTYTAYAICLSAQQAP